MAEAISHAPSTTSARPAKYRLGWNEQAMKTALESVLHGNMTLGKAARTYNIPKSTLFDHKKWSSHRTYRRGRGRLSIFYH